MVVQKLFWTQVPFILLEITENPAGMKGDENDLFLSFSNDPVEVVR
jgi:hypothetical protein